MNILVTGGTGYIGSALVPALLAKGYFVTVLDKPRTGEIPMVERLKDPHFRLVLGDARDYFLMKELLAEQDFVIPLAAVPSAPQASEAPDRAWSTNYFAIETLENAIKEVNPDIGVIFPMAGAYGDVPDGGVCTEDMPLKTHSLYAETKVRAENLLLQRGNAVIFRMAVVFGMSPRMRWDLLVHDFVLKATRDGYILLFQPGFRRDLIHITDVINAFIFAIEDFNNMKGQVYNLSNPALNMTKRQLCEIIKQVLPKFFIAEHEFSRDPDSRNYTVSIDKLRATGFVPTHLLDSATLYALVGLYHQ